MQELFSALQVLLLCFSFLAFLPAFAGVFSTSGAFCESVDSAPPVVSAAYAEPDIKPSTAAAARNEEPILMFMLIYFPEVIGLLTAGIGANGGNEGRRFREFQI